MAQTKHPERLISWIVRCGGIRDENGDLASMLGSYRARPCLIRHNAPHADDVALAAWECGFLTGTERPAINDLIDAIDQDHNGDAVVRDDEMTALFDWQDAQRRQELSSIPCPF